MSTHLRTDSPVPQSTRVPAAPPRKTSGKALAAMLLAALVSALIVVADSIVDTYADGHLLVGWISLWALGFAALGLLANTAHKTAERLSYLLGSWGQRRGQKRSDAYLLALAQHDPRIMAEVQAALQRACAAARSMDQALGQAWVERNPVGTFNAAYQGAHNSLRTTPLTGLPTHLQYLPC